MPITHISATELKNNTATVLNSIYYGEGSVIIERHGKPLVKMVSIKETNFIDEDVEKKLDLFFGSIPDMGDTKNNFSRKKDLALE